MFLIFFGYIFDCFSFSYIFSGDFFVGSGYFCLGGDVGDLLFLGRGELGGSVFLFSSSLCGDELGC